MRRDCMLRRGIQHFLLSSRNFEGAIFLTRIISAIDRFSIRHISLPVCSWFSFQKRRQAAALESLESFRGEKFVAIRV